VSKRRSVLRVVLACALIGLFAIAAAYGWLRFAPRRAPAGQPALVTLAADSIDPVRDAFDAHPDQVRVLALLSPT
jgi:hypothetical protein